MKRFGIAALAIVAVCAAAAPAQAQDKKRLSAVGASGSDPDKAEARKKVIQNVIEWVLSDYDPSCIEGAKLDELVESCGKLLKNESWKPTRAGKTEGKYTLSADVSYSQAKEAVYRVIPLDDLFGGKKIITYVQKEKESNSGLNSDEPLRAKIKGECSKYLADHRFNLAPSDGEQDKLDKAAGNLGVDPTTAAMGAFAGAVEADWVLTIRSNVAFTKYPKPMGQFIGELRIRICEAKLYNKESGVFDVRTTLNSTKDRRQLSDFDGDPERFPQVQVSTNEDPDEAAEKYSGAVGKAIGSVIVKQLFKRFVAGQGGTDGSAGGKGDGDGEGGGKARPPRPDEFYTLMFKGLNDDEMEEVMNLIKENAKDDGWSKIQEKGSQGGFHVYRVGYTGGEAKTAIRAYLKEANLHEKFRVETNGDKAKELVITKK